MPVTLSDFANKVENASGNHLVQVKVGATTQPQTVTLAVSPQTLKGRTVEYVEVIPAAAAKDMRPEDIKATHAALLQAIGEYYCLSTNVSSDIAKKYEPTENGPPELRTEKPLTCRDVKQILASADKLASKESFPKMPSELVAQISLDLDRSTLGSMVLVNKWLCNRTTELHMTEQAKDLDKLNPDKRDAKFIDLFRYFTGVDLLDRPEQELPKFISPAPGNGIGSKGVIELINHLQLFDSDRARRYFNRIFSANELLKSDNQGEVLVALTRRLRYVTNGWEPERLLECFDKLFDAIQRLEPKEQRDGWAGLASQLRLFAPDQMRILFDRIFDAIEPLPSKGQGPALGVLTQHLRQISNNEESELLLKYSNKLFDAIQRLEPENQHDGLAGLAFQLWLFAPDQARILFDRIFDATESLASKGQRAVLKALAQSLLVISNGAPELRLKYFNKLFDAVQRLEPADQCDAWLRLTIQLSSFAPDQARILFDRILNATEPLTSKDWEPILSALMVQLKYLTGEGESALLPDFFYKLCEAIKRLKPEDRERHLKNLGIKLQLIPSDLQRDVFARIKEIFKDGDSQDVRG